MRITQLNAHRLRLPLPSPIALDDRGPITHVDVLLVHLETDSGSRGVGFTHTLSASRALLAVTEDELASLVVGEDPLYHERLTLKFARRRFGSGLAARAWSAVDLALWDLKGKSANLPLWKLLGGARDSAPVIAADVGWPGMSGPEIVTATRACLERGFRGAIVRTGHADPEIDARRLQHFRDAFDEDVWLGVDGRHGYDYGTGLAMGHFLTENVAPDWFENPVAADDVESHARLAEQLGLPIAVGSSLAEVLAIRNYLEQSAVDVLRPDVAQFGGLTMWLKAATLAELHHRPVAPPGVPQLGVHLACGLPGVMAVEWLPWLAPILPLPDIRDGLAVPPAKPGLGVEVESAALERYRIAIG